MIKHDTVLFLKAKWMPVKKTSLIVTGLRSLEVSAMRVQDRGQGPGHSGRLQLTGNFELTHEEQTRSRNKDWQEEHLGHDNHVANGPGWKSTGLSGSLDSKYHHTGHEQQAQ